MNVQDAQMAPSNVGKLKAMHDIAPLMEDAREMVDKAADLEKKYVGDQSYFNQRDLTAHLRTFLPRFIVAAKEQSSVKKTVFFRARHLVTEIEKSKLSLLHLLHTFVSTLLKIVAGRGGPISHVSKTLLLLIC